MSDTADSVGQEDGPPPLSLADQFELDQLKRERLVRHQERLMELAPRSLAAHATLFHTTDTGEPIVPRAHHLEWMKILSDIENYRWVVIVAPPAYAKSTICSIVYPTWEIGRSKGKIRIGIVSNTASLTYGLSREIQRAVTNPLFAEVYGKGVLPNHKRGWRQDQFWCQGSLDAKNPTVMAAGMGGPIQGMRYDLIVFDDPTTWDDVRSEQMMENQRHFLKALLLQRFPPGKGPPKGNGRMVSVMTRWHERDLVPTLQDVGFKVVTMPALGYWDRTCVACQEIGGAHDATCKPPYEYIWGDAPLWVEKEDQQSLFSEREDNPTVFELVKQGNPRVLSGDIFDPANFQRGPYPGGTEPRRIREAFDQVVQMCDTAGGKDRKAGDYFAMATIGIRGDGEEVWILDMDRDRYSAPVQERRVVVNADKWNPDLIGIEDRNEGTALYQRMVSSTRLPLKAIKAGNLAKEKEFRAIPLANAYRGRKVWHPERERWVQRFEQELAAFPTGANDDQVDAACGAFNETGSAGPRLRVLTAPMSGRRW